MTTSYRAAMCNYLRLPVIHFPEWHPGAATFRHLDKFAGTFDDVLALADELAAKRVACVRAANIELPAGWVLS